MTSAWSPAEAKLEQYAADEMEVEQGKIRVRVVENKSEIMQRENQAQEALRNAGALDFAPPNDEYDYAGSMGKGYVPTVDESGNVTLPAEFYKPNSLYVSGYDVATGDKVLDSPADEAGRQRLRMAQAKARREMNFMEWAGCVLSEGSECPVEGAMSAVQSGSRVVADSVLTFFESARQLTEAASGDVLQLPEIAQVPEMGTWEGMASTLMQFMSGYGMAGKGLQVTGAASKMTGTQAEFAKDAMATFMLDPSEGNLVNLAKEFGVLDEEDLQWLDAERLAEMGSTIGARAAAVATDTAPVVAITAGAQVAWKKLKAFHAQLSSANQDMIRRLNEAGGEMVKRGAQRQRNGIVAIRSGVPMDVAAGMAEEVAGKAVQGAAGNALRAAESFDSLVDQAQGYLLSGAQRDDFVAAMKSSHYPDELVNSAWDRAESASAEGARQIENLLRPPPSTEGMISTRYPTAVRAEEDPMTGDLLVGLEPAMRDTEAFKHNVDLMAQYDNYVRAGARGAQAKAEQLIGHMKANLLRLYDDVPEQIRERSKLWYVGANRLANDMAIKYDISPEAASAVYAALSPQKDWFQNVSLGNRVIDIHSNGGDWNDAMDASLDVISPKIKNKAHQTVIEAIRGKSYEELDNPVEKALWIRVYDEGLNDRSYQIVTPEGDLAELQTTKSGTPATAAWGSLNEISSAVSVLMDSSMNNISKQMGGQHKVRNFYNNIVSPQSDRGDVTIDTHAVAAALFKPLAGSDKEVLHNFGSNVKGQRGPKNSAITGLKGTYPIYAEAYRRAAQERGVLPREMQSVTWEAVRGLFTDVQKTAQNKSFANSVWKRYKKGEISQEEAQNMIEAHFGGVKAPDWHE